MLGLQQWLIFLIRYRGTTVVNSYFNGHARLELAVPATSGSPDPTSNECQYWRGAMCGLVVTANQFSCSNGMCATIDTTLYTPGQADQMHVAGNAFEQSNSSAVCTAKSTCDSKDDCKTLWKFGTACDKHGP